LQCPSSGEPPALAESWFPRKLRWSGVFPCGDIWKIDIAFNRIPVPSKHRVDSLLKLSAAWFVDATAVYPEILQAVFPGLFSTESNLSVAELVDSNTICQILKGDLLVMGFPRVWEYGVARNIAREESG
jgi:hypothetical protein